MAYTEHFAKLAPRVMHGLPSPPELYASRGGRNSLFVALDNFVFKFSFNIKIKIT